MSASARACRVRAPMHPSRSVGGGNNPAQNLDRQIGLVESVIGAGIDRDRHLRTAAARVRDHLLAGLGGRPVVGGANQDQGRHTGAPTQCVEFPAAGIEGDRGAKIWMSLIGGWSSTDCIKHGGRPVRPAEREHAVGFHEGLVLQPAPGGVGVGDPLATGAHLALADAALRSEAARPKTVREQDDESDIGEPLGPVAVALGDAVLAESGASVQGDHRGEGAIPVRPVQHRVERDIGPRNADLLGSARGAGRLRIGGRENSHQQKSDCGPHRFDHASSNSIS